MPLRTHLDDWHDVILMDGKELDTWSQQLSHLRGNTSARGISAVRGLQGYDPANRDHVLVDRHSQVVVVARALDALWLAQGGLQQRLQERLDNFTGALAALHHVVTEKGEIITVGYEKPGDADRAAEALLAKYDREEEQQVRRWRDLAAQGQNALAILRAHPKGLELLRSLGAEATLFIDPATPGASGLIPQLAAARSRLHLLGAAAQEPLRRQLNARGFKLLDQIEALEDRLAKLRADRQAREQQADRLFRQSRAAEQEADAALRAAKSARGALEVYRELVRRAPRTRGEAQIALAAILGPTAPAAVQQALTAFLYARRAYDVEADRLGLRTDGGERLEEEALAAQIPRARLALERNPGAYALSDSAGSNPAFKAGRHAGRRFSEVPIDYLHWIASGGVATRRIVGKDVVDTANKAREAGAAFNPMTQAWEVQFQTRQFGEYIQRQVRRYLASGPGATRLRLMLDRLHEEGRPTSGSSLNEAATEQSQRKHETEEAHRQGVLQRARIEEQLQQANRAYRTYRKDPTPANREIWRRELALAQAAAHGAGLAYGTPRGAARGASANLVSREVEALQDAFAARWKTAGEAARMTAYRRLLDLKKEVSFRGSEGVGLARLQAWARKFLFARDPQTRRYSPRQDAQARVDRDFLKQEVRKAKDRLRAELSVADWTNKYLLAGLSPEQAASKARRVVADSRMAGNDPSWDERFADSAAGRATRTGHVGRIEEGERENAEIEELYMKRLVATAIHKNSKKPWLTPEGQKAIAAMRGDRKITVGGEGGEALDKDLALHLKIEQQAQHDMVLWYMAAAQYDPNWVPHDEEWLALANTRKSAWSYAVKLDMRVKRAGNLAELDELEEEARRIFQPGSTVGVAEFVQYLFNNIQDQRNMLGGKDVESLSPAAQSRVGQSQLRKRLQQRLPWEPDEVSLEEQIQQSEDQLGAVEDLDYPFPKERLERMQQGWLEPETHGRKQRDTYDPEATKPRDVPLHAWDPELAAARDQERRDRNLNVVSGMMGGALDLSDPFATYYKPTTGPAAGKIVPVDQPTQIGLGAPLEPLGEEWFDELNPLDLASLEMPPEPAEPADLTSIDPRGGRRLASLR